MTNQVTMEFANVIISEPWPIGAMLWFLTVVLMPAISIASFVRYVRLQRKGIQSFWQPRIILLASLAVTTSTALIVAEKLRTIIDCAVTMQMGAAQKAMASLTLSHVCITLSLIHI